MIIVNIIQYIWRITELLKTVVKNNSLNYNIIQQYKREKKMTVKEFYEAIECNYNEAKDRMMNEGLILKFSLKFAEDKSFGDLKSALGRND